MQTNKSAIKISIEIKQKCLCITNSIYHSSKCSRSQSRDRKKGGCLREWVLRGIVSYLQQVNSVKLLKQISIVILIYYLHNNQSRLSRVRGGTERFMIYLHFSYYFNGIYRWKFHKDLWILLTKCCWPLTALTLSIRLSYMFLNDHYLANKNI